jgi:hypothetical protein
MTACGGSAVRVYNIEAFLVARSASIGFKSSLKVRICSPCFGILISQSLKTARKFRPQLTFAVCEFISKSHIVYDDIKN